MTRTIASRRQKSSAGRFVGRFAEQQLFRATLRQLAALHDRRDEQLTDDELSYAQIFLIAAEGGMGKTTLLRRFAAIIEENKEGAGAKALYLDWERHAPIADPNQLMRVLHDALCDAGFEREMQPYRDAIIKRGAAQKKAADAEKQYKSLANFGGKAVQLATGGLLDDELVTEGIHAGARGLAGLHEYVQKKLDPDQWKLYDDPNAITEVLMEALNGIATPKRPLVLLLDTYELADRFDSWLRQRALPQSNPRLIWAIAGREGKPFVDRYENEFGASLIGRILLDTFARPDVVAYLQQCGITAPDDELVDRLQKLSRGIPLALEGWFNLYQKNVELPPPDPAAPTTRREIVRQMTDRFLRYCNEDDKHLQPEDRRKRDETRYHILTLMLLGRSDPAALAAVWECSGKEAEEALNELADQFSFVFEQESERKPHKLVKEFLRRHLRDQSALPVVVENAVARLVKHFEGLLHQREREIWGTDAEPNSPPQDEKHAALLAEREAHQRRLEQLNIQLANYGVAAPPHIRTDHEQAKHAIVEIDARLAVPAANAPDGPRRPLWDNERWRETLIDLVNALCWVDRSGKRALWVLVPMCIEGLEFHSPTSGMLLIAADEFVEWWSTNANQLFKNLASHDDDGFKWRVYVDKVLSISDNQTQFRGYWRLTALQRAIAHLHSGGSLIKLDGAVNRENRFAALVEADKAAPLMPTDGGELAHGLTDLYNEIGQAFLPAQHELAVAAPEALHAFAAATRFTPTNMIAWFGLGYSYYKLKQYDEAIDAYQHAILLRPDLADLYHFLGELYYHSKQYNQALNACQKAIALDPSDRHAHNYMGHVYIDLKQYEQALAAYQRAIELDPSDAGAHSNLGVVYQHLKQYKQALAACQRAIELDPNDAHAHHNLGAIYDNMGHYEQALAACQRAIELDPNDAHAYSNLGAIYDNMRHYEQALAACQRAVELGPNGARAHKGLGVAYLHLKQYDQALAACQRAIELDPNDAQAHRNLGAVCYNLKQYNQALVACQQAITLDSNDARAHSQLGLVYRALKQFDQALATCQRSISLDPNDAEAHNNLGVVYLDMKQLNQAITVLQRAIELDLTNPKAYTNLSLVYRALKQYERALEAVQQSITLDPSDPNAHNTLGLVYLDQQQYGLAIAAFQQAITLDESFTNAHNNLGAVYLNQQQYDLAIAAFQQAVARDPSYAAPHSGLSNVYCARQQYDEAIMAYQEAIRLDPNYAELHNKLGSVYYNRKQYDEAIVAYQQAIHLDPAYAAPYYNLGLIYDVRGQYDEAITAYQEAIRLDPSDADPYIKLGLIYDAREQYSEAIAAYQRAIRLDPSDADSHIKLGRVYYNRNQYEDAIAAYQQAIALDPILALVHRNLGDAYRAVERYDEAIAAYQQAISLAPSVVAAYNGLGLVYESRKQYDEAIEAYQQAITLDPSFVWAHRNLGDVYRALKQDNTAIAAYQEATTLDPSNADLQHDMGHVYSNLGQYDQAIAAYRQAITLHPASNHWRCLGDLCSSLDRWDEARDAYNRSIELDSADYRSILALARIERQTGQDERAVELADRVRSLLPVNDFYNLACTESVAGDVNAAIKALHTAIERGSSVEWARQDPDFSFIRDDARYHMLVGLDGSDTADVSSSDGPAEEA